MIKIYLARHGQDLDNVNSILNGQRNQPLSEKGWEQARELAERISEVHISFNKVYSSPLSRAYDTAKTITDKLNLPSPEIINLLIERDFGIMTGKKHADIIPMCEPDILKTDVVTYFLSPEGAETFPVLMERARKLLDFLDDNHQDGNVLMVSHGDFGKMIYAEYYHLDWQEVLKKFHFGNSDLVLLSPDSPADEVKVFEFKQFNI
jgi:broad specificity phosphatase PhoE